MSNHCRFHHLMHPPCDLCSVFALRAPLDFLCLFSFISSQPTVQKHCLAPDSLGVLLTGQTEGPPSSLSSPVLDTPLDSPLSCADLTLDSTGELTVEDVRDFLTYACTWIYTCTHRQCCLSFNQALVCGLCVCVPQHCGRSREQPEEH